MLILMVQGSTLEETKGNPFEEDPICNLNLKETSEFVKSLPMGCGSQSSGHKRREKENNVAVWNSVARKTECPSTPGRPVFSFSSVPRKNVPSKWDDAEKWLFAGGSCHASPAHHAFHNQASKVSNSKASLEDKHQFNGSIYHSDVPLKGMPFFSPSGLLGHFPNDDFPFLVPINHLL